MAGSKPKLTPAQAKAQAKKRMAERAKKAMAKKSKWANRAGKIK